MTENTSATEVVHRETHAPVRTQIRGFGPRALVMRVTRRIAALNLVDMAFRVAGVSLTSAGLAHFVAPKLFAWITRPVFPEDTGQWVKVNGAAETGIGLALLDRRTRTAGVIGALVYVAHLGSRAVTAIGAQLNPPESETSATEEVLVIEDSMPEPAAE